MPGYASIVETSTIPVSAQMTTVDQNVPVIAMSDCSAGFFVFAAAAMIGAEPRPDSFEKSPRAHPNWSATMMPEPTAPPKAAFAVNAHSKMSTSASHRYAQFNARMITQPRA